MFRSPSPPPSTHNGTPHITVESPEDEPLLNDSEAGYQAQLATKPEPRKGDALAKFAALISILVLLITTWVVVLSNDPKSLGFFTPHPLLQSLALFFFTYGILTLQPTSAPQTKKAGLARHQAAMLVLGFPTIALGSFFMIYNKYTHGAPHFTSWHGIFGLVAIIWIVLQVLVGIASAWSGNPKAKAVYKYHRLSGYVLLPWLLVTAHLGGAWSTWVVDHTTFATSVIVYTIAPAIVLIAVYSRVRPSKMKFRL